MECQGRVSNVGFFGEFPVGRRIFVPTNQDKSFCWVKNPSRRCISLTSFFFDGESQKFASSILGRKKSFGL